MATNNLNNVISAKPLIPAGGVLAGTASSVLPTDATTALDATFEPIGFISDKGVSIAPSVSTTKKKAWGGTVIRVLTTDSAVETSFEIAEFLNQIALRLVYGPENTTFTAADGTHGNQVAVRFKGELPAVVPLVVEAKDAKKRIRALIPNFQITDQGDFTFDDNDTIDMAVKGEAYPTADGTLFYIFTDDAATTTV